MIQSISGSSTCSSKTVFFRTLVGILTLPTSDSMSVDEIVQFMEKELKVGKEIKNKVNQCDDCVYT